MESTFGVHFPSLCLVFIPSTVSDIRAYNFRLTGGVKVAYS